MTNTSNKYATLDQIETVTKHYLSALLWTMPGDDTCENPGDGYSVSDIPQETQDKAFAICSEFITKAGVLFHKAMNCYADGYGQHPDTGSAEAAFGHDMALTINGHGVGFWDRESEGLGHTLGQELTKVAEGFNPMYLYIGDDGLIYIEG